MIPLHLGLALLAAVIYAVSSLAYKRAFAEGATVGQSFFWNNLLLGVVFLPLALWNPDPIPWRLAPMAMTAGLLFFAGHWAGFQALQRGDVSLVTPLLGTKVLFVIAATRVVFGLPLRWEHLGAALLTVAGVVTMSVGGGRVLSAGSKAGSGARPATFLALACAAAFGVCDALVQEWAPVVGTRHFMAILFGTLALLSLAVVPFQRGASCAGPARMWRWLVPGVCLTSAQAMLVAFAIAWGRDAAGVNVAYSLRGVWSLVLVLLVGRWFGNRERQDAGNRVFAGRFLGAAMIFGAVVWVIVATP